MKAEKVCHAFVSVFSYSSFTKILTVDYSLPVSIQTHICVQQNHVKKKTPFDVYITDEELKENPE